MKYWLGVVSEEHVKKGVTGGFAQVCHGKKSPLARFKKDDWLIYYSPKKTMTGTEICKSFTAIGEVEDDVIFQFKMAEDFTPYRRSIKYHQCKSLPIDNVKNQLDLTRDKNWGYKLRFGVVELSESDFKILKKALLEKK